MRKMLPGLRFQACERDELWRALGARGDRGLKLVQQSRWL